MSAKAHLFTAAVILAILSGLISSAESLRTAANIETLAEKVHVTIGNQEKNVEQILLELGAVDGKSFAAALELLQSQHRLESRIEQATLYRDQQVPLRLWRALPQ